MNCPTILFVDDDANLLNGLRRALHGKLRGCELLFADSGEKALEVIDLHPVDVIVSDMRMPGMDGATLLTYVRMTAPHIARIALSGFAREDSVLQSIGVAHQYLAKPCSSETLVSVVAGILKWKTIFEDKGLQACVGQLETLPTIPSVYDAVTTLLQRQDADLADLTAIIERDVAMTAEILKLTNSQFFLLPHDIFSVERALQLLGVSTLRTLTAASGIFRPFEGTAKFAALMEEMAERTRRLGRRAYAFAEDAELDRKAIEKSFCAGVLAEVGVLLMLDLWPERYLEVLHSVEKNSIPLHQAEEAAFGTTHARLGGYMMGLWGFSDEIVEAIYSQYDPSEGEGEGITPLAILYAARNGETIAAASSSSEALLGLDEEYIEARGLRRLFPVWEETLRATECRQ